MAQRILLADDSMTAQNMGKKILAEGGYDVVAVSNGAAAVKKIAEQKPDLVILDVYMPGYSGLEVCERMRGALATAKLPVLLTVGKLEPFQPEEGRRVKADGLLIKPFEATDLLAAVKRLLEVGAAAAAIEQPPAPVAVVPEAAVEEPPAEEKPQTIEVPQEMAAVPAMADVLDIGAQETSTAEPQDPAALEMSMAAAAGAGQPEVFSVEPAMPDFADAPVPAFDADLHLDNAADVAPPVADTPSSVLDAIMAEVEAEPAPPVVPAIEHTSEPQAPEVVAETLPDLEPTILQDDIPVEVTPDADLVTSVEEMSQFVTRFTDAPEEPVDESASAQADAFVTGEVPAIVEPEASVEEAVAPEPILEPEPELVPEAAAEPEPAEPVAEAEPAVEEPVAAESEPPAMEQAVALPVEPAALAEETEAPPVEASVEDQAFSLAQELQRAFAEEHPGPAMQEARVEESLADGAEMPVEAGSLDEAAIGRIVERLAERLKPELVAAILRELKR